MNLRARLSERVHIEDIREILHFIQDDEQLREEVYQFIFDEDDIVSYQALWVCTHFSKEDVEWLSRRQNELIDAAMTCPHSGKRRMLLNLLSQQPAANPPRMDFLDFCLERVISRHKTCLSTDLFHSQTATGTTHNAGNHGTRIIESRHSCCTQKYPKGDESKKITNKKTRSCLPLRKTASLLCRYELNQLK